MFDVSITCLATLLYEFYSDFGALKKANRNRRNLCFTCFFTFLAKHNSMKKNILLFRGIQVIASLILLFRILG